MRYSSTVSGSGMRYSLMSMVTGEPNVESHKVKADYLNYSNTVIYDHICCVSMFTEYSQFAATRVSQYLRSEMLE
ncbi:hypothetical protein FOCC_FOCC008269 [Frankliniella occidentalis]|nr:hypothetical protein FOCC_FOCC008269 [Frankliniella occidentalis]